MNWLKYNPNNCLGCRCCMTVKGADNVNCRSLISMIKNGGPRFDDKECASSNCTECVDICSHKALIKG